MWMQSLCVVAYLALQCHAAPTASQDVNNTPMIPLKIKLPDSTEVVKTEVSVDSTVPDCVGRDAATVVEDGGLTVTAEVFTECARGELRRIQDELSKPLDSNGIYRGNKAEKSADTVTAAAPAASRQEPSMRDHDKVNKDILAQHGLNKEKAPKEKGDNSTTDAVKAAGSSQDMLAVLQTVFDYKRVINDLRRILHGDVFGVLGEYPGRMNGLFKMVQELPKRIMKSIGIVNRLRTDTTDNTFRGVLTNLRDYLTQASQTSKSLPEALNMIRVIETLRNVATKIGDNMYRRTEETVSQRALLSRVEDVLTSPIKDILPRGGHSFQARLASSAEIFNPVRAVPDYVRGRLFHHLHEENTQ